MRRVLVVLLGLVGLFCIVAPAIRAEAPSVYAIRGARIVPVAGPVIDSGTVVIARGAIVAVGTSVAPPPEAWVIDGKGLTVYPGLIDAWTDLGLPAPTPPTTQRPGGAAPGGAAPGGGASQPPARGPEDRPASTPWRQAADELKADDRRLETWRQAGFTAALSAPKTGILAGQGAVIALAGDRPGDLVVHSPATLQLTLQPGGGFASFPGSLMGTVAYVRQVFLDAEHDRAARRAYSANAPGIGRPEYDRTVRALQEAQQAGLPVLVPATTATQIARVLRLSKELSWKPVIVGGHDAARVADLLATAKTPVIVSLKWPERDRNSDPDAVETLRSLRLRANAPAVPAALDKAGVSFAFSSDGVPPADILKHVRKAIAAGLGPEAALRGLTLTAAQVLGVAGRLGSIETGKAAHLIVTDGDLFAEKTRITMAFVDGVKFEIPEPAKPAAGEEAKGPTASAAGKWALIVNTPTGVQHATLDLSQGNDGSLTGSMVSPMGTLPLTGGSVTGPDVTFSVTMPMGGTPMTVTFSATVDGNRMTGTMSAGDFSGDFTGTRGPGRE